MIPNSLRTTAGITFDRVAWFYDGLAKVVFADAIRKSQVALLRFIPAHATVLLLGGGTGWLLADLARLNIPLTVLYLECSPNMLACARWRFAALPPHLLRVTFRLGTEVDVQPAAIFEVIVTPFVLDLYPEAALRPMLQRLQRLLKTDGRWLFVDFYLDRTRANGLPSWQRCFTQAMYLFFSRLCGLETRTLPDFDRLFENIPVQLTYTQYFYRRFIRAQVYRRT